MKSHPIWKCFEKNLLKNLTLTEMSDKGDFSIDILSPENK